MSYDFSHLDYRKLLEGLLIVDDMRIWRIAEALRRGISIEELHDITKIDCWFIDKLKILVEMEKALKEVGEGKAQLTPDLLREAKRLEFPDTVIGRLTGMGAGQVKKLRYNSGIRAAYKMVDTCAAEFAAETPYYYSCFGSYNEAEQTTGRKKVLVLGSGPIRIGQGIEFDFCSVHSTWAFRREGYETIIINNNPETVSTDFDIADKLYFEPLTAEDVESIVDIEKPDGAVVQFGGQTAIKLTEALMKMGVPILGTAAEDVDAAEDRERFDAILEQCRIPRPAGIRCSQQRRPKRAAKTLGYPVLVRPSYVLGGRACRLQLTMRISTNLSESSTRCSGASILVDKYIMGKEIEVDAHLRRRRYSGFPALCSTLSVQEFTPETVFPSIRPGSDRGKYRHIVDYTEKLARALHVKGMINIQFIVDGDDVYIIEVNPRSSRTVPYISKVTGIPIVPLATQIILRPHHPGAGIYTGTSAGGGLHCYQDAGILL